MGKLASGASFQMKLAFMDDDLKRPKHDEIMFWLTERVKDPAFGQALLPPFPRVRIAYLEHLLREDARALMTAAGHTPYHFQSGDRETKEKVRREPWADEPVPTFKFKQLRWEPPLKEKERVIAFADLLAEYECGHTLLGFTTQHYTSSREEVSAGRYGAWRYVEAERSFSFREDMKVARIFFEVKTEIRSVGELLRQLNLYSETEQMKGRDDYDGLAPRLVVVAPPHKEAEEVCRSHGYGFVEYLP